MLLLLTWYVGPSKGEKGIEGFEEAFKDLGK
jgi:hypothetical protein